MMLTSTGYQKEKPADSINKLLQDLKQDQCESALSKMNERLTREEKELEDEIDLQMGLLTKNLPLVWNDIEHLQQAFEVLDSQASNLGFSDHVSPDSLNLIKQIEEIDSAKKKLEFLEDCLERNK